MFLLFFCYKPVDISRLSCYRIYLSLSRDAREAARMERLRQRELAPAGQKSLRNRVQARKGRTKEQMLGQKRHEEAMREMARRKHESVQKGPAAAARNARIQRGGRAGGIVPKKGISSGVRNKNKHLQDFENLKAGHKKRRGKMQFESYIYRTPPPCLTIIVFQSFMTLPIALIIRLHADKSRDELLPSSLLTCSPNTFFFLLF